MLTSFNSFQSEKPLLDSDEVIGVTTNTLNNLSSSLIKYWIIFDMIELQNLKSK